MGALVSLITGPPKRTLLSKQLDGSTILLIDVTTKITPKYESDVTDNPVEDGSNVNDNVKSKPITIQVDGVISQSPLTLQSQFSGLITSGASIATQKVGGFAGSALVAGSGALGATLLKTSGSNGPVADAFKRLTDMIQNKTIFSLVDRYTKYENLIMTSLSFPSDAKTGQKLEFSFTCKQLRIIYGQTTKIEKIAKPVSHSAGPKEKKGQLPPNPGDPPTILRQGFNFLTGHS